MNRTVLQASICAALLVALGALLPSGASAALTGQIAGRVTDLTSKAPLSGVGIVAVSPSARYAATTDAGGRYVLVGVVPDTYTVSFQKSGYAASAVTGVTVLPDAVQTVDVVLENRLRTIGHVVARSANAAFQPNQTEDSYTVNASAIEAVQGKAFNSDEKSLLSRLPAVTLDSSGSIFIRGGDTFQVGYQMEGVDYTEPNRSLQNRSTNVGNFDLLNGVGSVQLIPGGGDASHGDTGTGLVSLGAKRGTFPAFATIDLEVLGFPYTHQLGLEYGAASRNGRFSYFAGFTGIRKAYQYGAPLTAGASIGIFTDPTTLTSVNGANSVGVTSTASDQESNDFIFNSVYKFGRGGQQSLQLFGQSQAIRQGLSYNGIGNQCYASCGPFSPYRASVGATPLTLAQQAIVPLFPGQTAFNQLVGAEDQIVSPFSVYKLEYANNLNASSYAVARFYRTFGDQNESRPSLGIDNPQNGGTRSGVSAEYNLQRGKHFIQIGGKFEFVQPFGTLEDVINYESGYLGAGNVWPFFPAPSNQECLQAGGCIPAVPVYADFMPASICGGAGAPAGQTKYEPGLIVNGNQGVSRFVPCGYLSSYFPHGIPTLPPEVESPHTNQQIYGWFIQDRFPIGKKTNVQAGIRLDGYSFLFAEDPQNPPSIATVAHQRLFEPHLGITRQLTSRDSLRATYGRTLSIPLPGLSGNLIDRSTFAAFDKVPSYDNLTGLPAQYCGLALNQKCASYADQLFWVMRDTRFPNTQIAPVRGATFTNYDLTYSHAFRNGSSLAFTPFFRRGYDIVEQSTTLTFANNNTLAPIVRPSLESNLGVQKATGLEGLFTYEKSPGLSYRLSATYLNQLGNDPPLNYLSTPSLLLGSLYRSPLFSPFQSTLAVIYSNPSGLRINPVFTYKVGYPYGVGSIVAVFLPDGQPAYVPNTNIGSGTAGNTPFCYVDPQYSGTLQKPNIVACTGSPEKSTAGGLLSQPSLNLDINLSMRAPNTKTTYGMAIANVFDQLYGVPYPNPYFGDLIATGVFGPKSGEQPGSNPNTGGNGPAGKSGAPKAFPPSSFGSYPYLLFPNQPPLAVRFYVQFGF